VRIASCIVLVLLLLIPAPSFALYKCRDFKGEEMTSAVPCERLGYLDIEKDKVFMEQLTNPVRRAQVIRVIDGDTLRVDIDGIHEKVRLIGIDAPEGKDPRKKRGKKVEYFSSEAAQYADRHLRNRTVRLEFDRANSPNGHRDKYGRLLAYVYVGEELFNLRIIRDGYAHAYTKFPFSMMEEFRQAEREARRAERGLWSSVTAPSGKTVYITSTGSKYHRDGCRFLNKSKVEANLERVIDLGYEPCRVCRP
jgi:micrococcal nuclease